MVIFLEVPRLCISRRGSFMESYNLAQLQTGAEIVYQHHSSPRWTIYFRGHYGVDNFI